MQVLAPLSGWASPLGEVPDPVFADRVLGDGLAIDPTSDTVRAPCDGTICALAAHAVTIRHESGAEILVHLGLETVALKGEGFTALVQQGQAVEAGDPLIQFDLDFLAGHAKSLITPVIVANGEAFAVVRRMETCEIIAGAFLMEVLPLAVTAVEDIPGNIVTRTVVIASEHGLHARPSALLASAAKHITGEVLLSSRGRSASAKSAVSVMALGVHHGEEVTISAPADAVDGLVAILKEIHREPPVPLAASPQHRAENTATRLYGIPAAPGKIIGTAVRLKSADLPVSEEGAGMAAETEALRRALAVVRARLQQPGGDEAAREIRAAHLELLDDPEFHATALHIIELGKSAGFAWREVLRAGAETLRVLDDPRMRERAADLRDLERQVLAELCGTQTESHRDLPPHAILIADEILPSDLANSAKLAGLISVGGGPTSHMAILAAGMNLPALVGVGPEALAISDGAEILLDADEGFVDLSPSPEVLAAVKDAAARNLARTAREAKQASDICFTADGARVEIFANLGKGAEEAAAAIAYGAEGCGLLRTEFLFMERATPPAEAEQLVTYQAIADALAGCSFILRTFDIGADKPVPYLSFPPEENPQLGLRGVRTGLAFPDLLRTQLRAALQVKPAGLCKILLPMITGLEEVKAVRALMEELCTELSAPCPELGVMVETPASAMLADQLLREADFLSLGTNDLTQYTLAIDRTHAQLSSRLDALHPAVLRLIARVGEAAKAAGKTAAVCGGLAADPVAAPLLIGLGITELSVPAPAIARLKAIIRTLRSGTCRAVAREALTLENATAVRAFAKARFVGED